MMTRSDFEEIVENGSWSDIFDLCEEIGCPLADDILSYGDMRERAFDQLVYQIKDGFLNNLCDITRAIQDIPDDPYEYYYQNEYCDMEFNMADFYETCDEIRRWCLDNDIFISERKVPVYDQTEECFDATPLEDEDITLENLFNLQAEVQI